MEPYEKTKLTKAPTINGLVKTSLAPGYTLAGAPTTLAGCKQNYIKLLINPKQKSRIRHTSQCTSVGLPATGGTRISKAHEHFELSNFTA